jgi:hypothetical protein
MDNMSAGELARAAERIADALEAIRQLMFEKNELLKESIAKQGEANGLTQKGLTALALDRYEYQDAQPKENL